MLQAKIYIQINTFINKFLNYIYILYKDFDMYLHKLHHLNNNQIHYTYVMNMGYIRLLAVISTFGDCHCRKTGWKIPLWRVCLAGTIVIFIFF